MPKYSLNRKVSAIACAIATAIIGIDFSMGGKPAHADSFDLNCVLGVETVKFDPGITNTPRPITTTEEGQQVTCISSDSKIESVKFKAQFQGDNSCLAFGLPTYIATYTFNNGDKSKVEFESAIFEAEGENLLIQRGKVISGKFQGDKVIKTITNLTLSPQKCLTTEGIASISGAVTVQFIK